MAANADPFNFKIPKNIEFGDVGQDEDVFNKTNGWGSPEFYSQKRAKERQQKLDAIETKLRRMSALKEADKENHRPGKAFPAQLKCVNKETKTVLQPPSTRSRAASQPPTAPVVSKPRVESTIRQRSNSIARTPVSAHTMALRGRPQEKKPADVPPVFVRKQAVKATPTLTRPSPLVRRSGIVQPVVRNPSLGPSKVVDDPKARSLKGVPVVSAYRPGQHKIEENKLAEESSKENQKPKESIVQRVLRSFSQPRSTPKFGATSNRPSVERKPIQSTPRAIPVSSRASRPVAATKPPVKPPMPKIVKLKAEAKKENVPNRVDASGTDVLNKKPIERRFSFMAPTFSSRRRSVIAKE